MFIKRLCWIHKHFLSLKIFARFMSTNILILLVQHRNYLISNLLEVFAAQITKNKLYVATLADAIFMRNLERKGYATFLSTSIV